MNESLRANYLHVKSMQRRDRQSCGAIRVNEAERMARIARITCHSRELRNLNFDGYSRRINQSGACSSSDVITSGGQWRTKLHIHLRTFTKTGIHFATSLELPGRSPSHDAYSRLLCSQFHTRMKRISCVNSVNFTRK